MGCNASDNAEPETSKAKNKPNFQVDQDKIDQAVLDHKVVRDQLKIYQKQQERCQEIELEKARELAKKGQKDRAKMVLRQKKAREYYINNAEKMIQNVEVQINNVQTKQMEMAVLDNIKSATDILKHMNDLMPIEEVERIMDENQEQNDRLNEINDLLAQDMNPEMKQFVDEDLDRMYEELETGEPEPGKAVASADASGNDYQYSAEEPQKMAMPA